MPGIMIPLVRRLEIEEYAIQKGFEQIHEFTNPRRYVTRLGLSTGFQPPASEDVTKCFFRSYGYGSALITTTRTMGSGYDCLYIEPKGDLDLPLIDEYHALRDVYMAKRRHWLTGAIIIGAVDIGAIIGGFFIPDFWTVVGLGLPLETVALGVAHDRKVAVKPTKIDEDTVIVDEDCQRVEIFYGHRGLDKLGFPWRKKSRWKPWVRK